MKIYWEKLEIFFPIGFVVIDMKEDEDVHIILGRSLHNTTRTLVDVRKSKLTLRVRKKEMTFGVEEGFKKSKNQDEVFFMDDDNELEELIDGKRSPN